MFLSAISQKPRETMFLSAIFKIPNFPQQMFQRLNFQPRPTCNKKTLNKAESLYSQRNISATLYLDMTIMVIRKPSQHFNTDNYDECNCDKSSNEFE